MNLIIKILRIKRNLSHDVIVLVLAALEKIYRYPVKTPQFTSESTSSCTIVLQHVGKQKFFYDIRNIKKFFFL